MRHYKNSLKQQFYNEVLYRVRDNIQYIDLEIKYKDKGLSLMARQAVVMDSINDINGYKERLKRPA